MCFFYPSKSSNKHTGPVWQLRWVEQDRGATGDGKKERLMCISADGRITEWLIQKRLDCTGKHFPLQLFCRGVIPEIAIASFYFRWHSFHRLSYTKHLRAVEHSKKARVIHSTFTYPFDKNSCYLHRSDENKAGRKREEKITRWERKEKWSSDISTGSWNVLWLPPKGRLSQSILAEVLSRRTVQQGWDPQLQPLSYALAWDLALVFKAYLVLKQIAS